MPSKVLRLTLLASISTLALTNHLPVRGPCAHAHRIIATHNVPPHIFDKLACVTMRPGHAVRVHLLASDFKGLQDYLTNAHKFAQDVASNLSTHGAALVVLDDDATLPLPVLQDLMRIKVPLLSHALRGKDKAPHVVFMPDFHFIDSGGFAETVAFVRQHSVPFRDKRPVALWRGSTTGGAQRALCNESTSLPCTDCTALPRVQLTLRASNIAWLDIKITNPVQYCDTEDARSMLAQAKATGDQVSSQLWHLDRGLINIDGNTNAWGHLWRMATGSVIFKVDSDYVNAYTLHQKPWVHYVPLLPDFADLEAVTSLVASDNNVVVDKLESIAKAAYELGQRFTYANEVARVARELETVWTAS